MTPAGYEDQDLERYGRPEDGASEQVYVEPEDPRSPFQHDADRILYSLEFRALADKTQVVAAAQLGTYHNRLTHSHKVAQVGRRLAVALAERAREQFNEDGLVGPDPDLVEASCLLHDIGHPAFGHIGERAICDVIDHQHGSATTIGYDSDGFQANAQNLRIATLLAERSASFAGLNLTRATLDAAVKYPWHRGEPAYDPDGKHKPYGAQPYGSKHWGCYAPDVDALNWILQGHPTLKTAQDPRPAGRREVLRPVEEEIMDWADEVTYACHDIEDFIRTGLVPLDAILRDLNDELQVGFSINLSPLPDDGTHASSQVKDQDLEHAFAGEDQPQQWPKPSPGYEYHAFLDYVIKNRSPSQSEQDVRTDIERGLRMLLNNYGSSRTRRAALIQSTSNTIKDLMGRKGEDGKYKVRLEPVTPTGDGPSNLTRYAAHLHIDKELRLVVNTLKSMIQCYVIDRPALRSQQAGQRRVLTEIFDWYLDDIAVHLPSRYGPIGEDNRVRACADATSALTETEACRLFERITGLDYGQVTGFNEF